MTRRLRYSVAATLDGFIADPDGGYDWIIMDESIDFAKMFEEFDTFVMGRKTWDVSAQTEFVQMFGSKEVIVFSRTLKTSPRPGVKIVRHSPADTVRELKNRNTGKDIWLFGGGTLFRTLADEGLVDTVEVAVMPVLLLAGCAAASSGRAHHRHDARQVRDAAQERHRHALVFDTATRMIARWLSIIFHPFVMVGVMVGTAAAARQTAGEALGSVAIVALFTIVPLAVLMARQVRRGAWDNADASNRAERPVLYLVGGVALVALLAYLLAVSTAIVHASRRGGDARDDGGLRGRDAVGESFAAHGICNAGRDVAGAEAVAGRLCSDAGAAGAGLVAPQPRAAHAA